MKHRSGYCALTVSLVILFLIGIVSSACEKHPAGPESNGQSSTTPGGLNGRFVGGVKHGDVVELFKLDVTRQGNELTGVLNFLSTMLDSIDNDVPQKIDPQIFENFGGHSPAKIAGKIDGSNVEFSQVEPLVVGNYIYSWHFSGQFQGDKLTGQLEEKLKND